MLQQRSGFRNFTLHFVAVFFCILNVTNIKISGLSDILPMFDLMIIFYFSVFKNRFGIWFLFLLGIWSDALNGSPMGITALCYILLCRLFSIANNRLLVKENFDHVWRQFILFCLFFIFLKWLILSIFNAGVISPVSAIAQGFISSLIYVPMHKFFDYLTVKLLGE
jgi:rod shape-determining protein MreD